MPEEVWNFINQKKYNKQEYFIEAKGLNARIYNIENKYCLYQFDDDSIFFQIEYAYVNRARGRLTQSQKIIRKMFGTYNEDETIMYKCDSQNKNKYDRPFIMDGMSYVFKPYNEYVWVNCYLIE